MSLASGMGRARRLAERARVEDARSWIEDAQAERDPANAWWFEYETDAGHDDNRLEDFDFWSAWLCNAPGGIG